MLLRLLLASCVWLWVPVSAQAAPPATESRLQVLEPVAVSKYRGDEGHGLKLSFKPLGPNPALSLFTLEDAREAVAALGDGSPPRTAHPTVVVAGSLLGHPPDSRRSDMERRTREAYEALYGPALVELPGSLESARWFQALALSPRYMGDGVREAAVEMFSSPAVLLSVGLSMMLYMMAWAAPDPVFSKAFAAAVSLGLLMTYTAAELYSVGLSCLNLYREAEAARTQEQLEAVAERFGKALGGVGLRVLVTVAGAKLARGLPEVPRGGLWARLSPPRFAFAGGRGGFKVSAGTRARVNVADGTVVLMGVSASTSASAVTAAASSARTTGACAESKRDDHHAHHLATNKNDKSESRGGPWTPEFKTLFARAGMSLEDPANIVYLRGHKGPHPEEYHSEIFERLSRAIVNCRRRSECRAQLVEELDKLAGDVCTPGSKLNKLVTSKP
ncbi:AHH domain-containing protein [Archangium violaceum]|uniref:AHH domain-containing protein n=1 Tax=Archangium violaceum TaxID=83451 RepID=UPI00193BC4A4|nr:AHH domain-containing protein [Archangium violaceum]QRK11987.1 AHH domain-containing protein [Archangium violaceum]